MGEKKIILDISKNGAITSRVEGVNGPSCAAISSWVDQLGKVTEDRETDDYYKPDGQEVNIGC